MDKYKNIAIALAGVCQSASIVNQLAEIGTYNREYFRVGIQSIFNTSPTSTEDVFGDKSQIRFGLQLLTQILGSNQKEHVNVIRYIFSTLAIANKLQKNKHALGEIANRLTRVSLLYSEFTNDIVNEHNDEIAYSLAGIYSDIISPLTTKIKVTGEVEYLKNPLVQAKVRTALFACIRAGMLWFQVGGTRWQIMFARKKIIQAANDLLVNYQ